jgi:hypothetical protein
VRTLLFIFALVLPLAGCQGERLREITPPGLGTVHEPDPALLCSASLGYLDARISKVKARFYAAIRATFGRLDFLRMARTSRHVFLRDARRLLQDYRAELGNECLMLRVKPT